MIEWWMYAFLAVIFGTMFVMFRKKALVKVHAMNFEAARSLSVAFLCLFLIPFINLNISWQILLIVYGVSLMGTFAILLMSKSLRHNDVSLVAPLSNFRPAFVAVLAYFFLGESLTLTQIAGVVIILFTTYLLESDHHFSNFLEPIRNFIGNRYHYYFLLAVFIFSIATIIDKYIVTYHLSIFTYYFLVWLFVAINFNFIHAWQFGIKDSLKCFKDLKYLPVLVAGFSFAKNLFALKALSMAYASLVTPVLMVETLFVVFVGGEFFHEQYRYFRFFVSALMLIGVYLIIM
ncbi:EamA family transporter [Candidatus Woesearchaeota archaeon]|nr:EamA family transporter [Candidatus Woesearchaeota archaeon]